MGLRKRSAVLAASAAAAALAITGCSSGGSSSSAAGGGSASSSASSAPSTLTVWRMGASVPEQVTWMNGVVDQVHQQSDIFQRGSGHNAMTQVKDMAGPAARLFQHPQGLARDGLG